MPEEEKVDPAEESEESAVEPVSETTETDTPVAPESSDPDEKPDAKDGEDGEDAKDDEDAKDAKDDKDESKAETAEDLLKADLEGTKIRKAKGSKNVSSGICHVLATFNNTKVTFSDLKGNVISWSSSGKCNFRGSRKSTAYAAQVVTQDAGRTAMSHGMKEVIVKMKGPGMGRDSAVRTLQSLGFIVTSIIDVTPVPHNGCRPPKRRRV
ncbi:MAG: 30S ribosomal protein S11 [Opitutae bacterium]|nr:30S ribosomal protein S11 [Opitutae bacterium]